MPSHGQNVACRAHAMPLPVLPNVMFSLPLPLVVTVTFLEIVTPAVCFLLTMPCRFPAPFTLAFSHYH